jgi:hypothetical protein
VAVPSHAQDEAKAPQAEPERAESAPPAPRSTEVVLALQRTGGKSAVSQMLARDGGSLISTGDLAANWQRRARRGHGARRGPARTSGSRRRLADTVRVLRD